MPRITTTTNVYLNKEKKYRMMVELKEAIEMLPHEKGEFLMADFRDDSFMLFGEDASDPCVAIEVNVLDVVYDMIDKATLETVLLRIAEIAGRYCGVPSDRVFAFYRNSQMWTCSGVNIVGNLLDI